MLILPLIMLKSNVHHTIVSIYNCHRSFKYMQSLQNTLITNSILEVPKLEKIYPNCKTMGHTSTRTSIVNA
jgi:hypothetical protein